MKPVIYIPFIMVLFVRCEKENDFVTNQLTDGFCIKFNEDRIINHHGIEYYDYSAHIVYLKYADTFWHQAFNGIAFTVYANFEEIYHGDSLPSFSCSIMPGPTINYFYPDFVISIGNVFAYDSTGQTPPDPFDSWNKEWFDLIRPDEKKSFTLFYDQFDAIPKGQYNASFSFPGLSYQVKNKEDLEGENGRIWLGKIDVKKQIAFN